MAKVLIANRLLRAEVERLRAGLMGLGAAASASLSDLEDWQEPHPDHLCLADWVMSAALLMVEDGMTYEQACEYERAIEADVRAKGGSDANPV